jgi:hypothetical protein
MRRSLAIAAEVLKWRGFYPWSLFTVNQQCEILVIHAVAKRKDAKPPLVPRKVHVDEVKARIRTRNENK